MKISLNGALIGAAVCSLGRGLVLLVNFGAAMDVVFYLPSMAIGGVVGLIAGSLGRPVVSGILGGIMSAGAFELFMLPCAAVLGIFGPLLGKQNAGEEFLTSTFVYALEMGLAGIVAGVAGGWFGQADVRPEPHIPVEEEVPFQLPKGSVQPPKGSVQPPKEPPSEPIYPADSAWIDEGDEV